MKVRLTKTFTTTGKTFGEAEAPGCCNHPEAPFCFRMGGDCEPVTIQGARDLIAVLEAAIAWATRERDASDGSET